MTHFLKVFIAVAVLCVASALNCFLANQTDYYPTGRLARFVAKLHGNFNVTDSGGVSVNFKQVETRAPCNTIPTFVMLVLHNGTTLFSRVLMFYESSTNYISIAVLKHRPDRVTLRDLIDNFTNQDPLHVLTRDCLGHYDNQAEDNAFRGSLYNCDIFDNTTMVQEISISVQCYIIRIYATHLDTLLRPFKTLTPLSRARVLIHTAPGFTFNFSADCSARRRERHVSSSDS